MEHHYCVLDVAALPTNIDRLIIVETNPRDLAVGLLMSSLENIVHECKGRGIRVNLIFDYELEALKVKMRELLIGQHPLIINGMSLVNSPIDNPKLSAFESWIKSPEGISQSVLGGFGSEVDEMNQLLQAIYTAAHSKNRQLLVNQSFREKQPVVLVASGPSLDQSIDWLKKHQHNMQIICAASSLGSLLRNGIVPSAAVFLERSSVVFDNDISELIRENYDLSNITLIASMTLDPRIAGCFKSVFWFHRPLSATLAFFPEEALSKLIQSGPQSSNAALESLLHLGHRKVLLIGCDFGAEKRTYPRSVNALGSSPRDLTLPVRGRSRKTIYSSPELYEASKYFTNAIEAYAASIYSQPLGISLETKSLNIIELDDNLAEMFTNEVPFDANLSNLPIVTQSSPELLCKIGDVKIEFNNYCQSFLIHF